MIVSMNPWNSNYGTIASWKRGINHRQRDEQRLRPTRDNQCDVTGKEECVQL